MGRLPRYVVPGRVVEVTTRTIQGRFLLRPSRELEIVGLGVVGRAQRKYDMEIHYLVFLSTHVHLLLSPKDAKQLADFMRFVNGNLATEVGRLHHWSNKLWARRYRPITVSDEAEAQISRFEYLLEHGCKEGLVSSPREWPGINGANAWLTGKPLKGLWFDRTKEYQARRRGEKYTPMDFAEEETVVLTALPCWSDLPVHRVRAEIAARVRDIEAETAARHKQHGTSPAGVEAVRARHPHDAPARVDSSPAPQAPSYLFLTFEPADSDRSGRAERDGALFPLESCVTSICGPRAPRYAESPKQFHIPAGRGELALPLSFDESYG